MRRFEYYNIQLKRRRRDDGFSSVGIPRLLLNAILIIFVSAHFSLCCVLAAFSCDFFHFDFIPVVKSCN